MTRHELFFGVRSSYLAQSGAKLYNIMTDAMGLLCDGHIFLCSWESQGPSNDRQRQVLMRHVVVPTHRTAGPFQVNGNAFGVCPSLLRMFRSP